MTGNSFQLFAEKMQTAGVREASARAFQHNYEKLISGDTGLIPEAELEQLPDPVVYGTLPAPDDQSAALLDHCVVIKLNGGLGTSMGLERAKSLLQVKAGLSFLDLIARQILHLRETHRRTPCFMLMNSYNTSADTVAFFAKYPQLGAPPFQELMQSQAPKIDAGSFRPARWEKSPALEWCPPGHGDIYPSLVDSGQLAALLKEGVRYAFVSNADNLGATLDLKVISYFSKSGASFMMEVAERTPSDRKGGHLAKRGGHLVLRESAQCPEADTPKFQDISHHRFFNTNNLWIRLDHLNEALLKNGGFLPLPIIRNSKTIDPRDKKSPAVIQLETAMGAAIQCFEHAAALVVPRTRFAPVKTCSDLLALRSDAYRITDDWRLVLARPGTSSPPTIDLDPDHYKLVDQLDAALRDGIPSLIDCDELRVRGPVIFSSKNRFAGKVTLTCAGSQPISVPAGEYRDKEFKL